MKTKTSPRAMSLTFVLLLLFAGGSLLVLQSCGGSKGKPEPTSHPPPT